MAMNITWFVLLLLLSLLVGTMVGISVGYNPSTLSAMAYVEQQQNAIRAFNGLLPAVGAICILLTVGLAFVARTSSPVQYLNIATAVLLVTAAVVTRFGNQPINNIVMTWSSQSPAANWEQLRDAWWQWHLVRSLAGVGALVLTFIAVLASRGTSA